MEITTSPRRPATTPWGRLLLLVVVLGPVSVLVLLPVGLGLERYVMTGDAMASGTAGGIPQGSVVFERRVPLTELRVGDVITFAAPERDELVTHRIVDLGPDGIRTQGDTRPAADPWRLRPQEPTMPRVVFTVPWLGYGYQAILHPISRPMVVISAVLLLALAAGEVRRRRRPRGGASGPASAQRSGTTSEGVVAAPGRGRG